MAVKNPLDTFEHIVVLMMENRSFDNMLGYLYPARQSNFDGLDGKGLSNPIPDYAGGGEIAASRSVGSDLEMWNPNPDPGEAYPHINTQLFNTVNPPANKFSKVSKMEPPYNAPGDAFSPPAPMNGFVTDYINNYGAHNHCNIPDKSTFEVIMQSFTPDQNTGVPVISGLAQNFAVCDQWHCAVPSQTFCNRSFFNAATSNGYVVNSPYINWIFENDNETIFERLESNGKSWKIYYDKKDCFSLTYLIHHPRLKKYKHSGNICTMKQFYKDVDKGNLPNYAFVEPRLFFNHNDEHPPVDYPFTDITQPSSVLAGEVLINDVYNAIRTSASESGSNYTNTLLQITYDEHGGCYDHVSPPSATPPGKPAGAHQMDFTFDRLGVRVPCVFISNYIQPNTIVNTPLQHTSMIKTMTTKWQIPGSLTDRDASATDISSVLGTTQRTEPWPELTARPFGGYDALTDKVLRKKFCNKKHPLNGLQKDVLGMVAAARYGADAPSLEHLKTVADAMKYLRKNRKKV